MILTQPSTNRLTMTKPAAAAALAVSERQVRKLVAAGRLTVVGSGQRARISADSVTAEIARREEKRNSLRRSPQRKAEQGRKSSRAVPFFCESPLDALSPVSDDRGMVLRMPTPMTDELLSLAAAAARVGMSERTLRRAVELGQLPAVLVGDRRRINAATLREWARGERVVLQRTGGA